MKRAHPESDLQKQVDLDFSISITPMGWSRARYDSRAEKGRFFKATKLARYQRRIAEEAALALHEAWGVISKHPIELELTLSMPMPKTWSKKKRNTMCGQFHTQTPDLDNLVKAICDACNGVLWKDDSQIAIISAQKIWNQVGAVTMSVSPHKLVTP